MLEHVDDRFPKQFQVLLRETGKSAGKVGRDISFRAVERIRNNVFAAHLGPFFQCILFGCDRNTGNGHLFGEDRVDAARKTDLYRAAYLTAV